MLGSIEVGGRLPVGRLFVTAFRLLRQSYGWQILFMLGGLIVPPLVAAPAVLLAIPINVPALAVIGILAGCLATVWLAAAEADLLLRILEGGRAEDVNSLRLARQRLPALAGLMLLVLFCAFVALGVLIAAFSAYIEWKTSAGDPFRPLSPEEHAIRSGITVLFGFVVFYPLTAITVIAATSERRGPIRSMERCADLLRDNLWRAMSVPFLTLCGSALLLIGLLFIVGRVADAVLTDALDDSVPAVLSNLLLWLLVVPFRMFAASVTITLYGMLRRLRDGAEAPLPP